MNDLIQYSFVHGKTRRGGNVCQSLWMKLLIALGVCALIGGGVGGGLVAYFTQAMTAGK